MLLLAARDQGGEEKTRIMNDSEYPLDIKKRKRKKKKATGSEEGGRVWILSKNPPCPAGDSEAQSGII